jgi:Cu2+-exporting ATPase
MKTSEIEVRDMLSVLSVDGVEKLIGEVPGVESVTVNFAAGSAAVRYDETRLKAADIKVAAHQQANAAPVEPVASDKTPAKAGAAPAAPTAAVGGAAPSGGSNDKPNASAMPDVAVAPTVAPA